MAAAALTANKENRAPGSGVGQGKAALKAARKTTTTKGAKSRPNDDDDDDELMMGSDDERDQHSPADETTVVAETQFGEPAAAGSKKGSKGTAAPAAAKRRPAAASKKAAATTDEFDVAEQEQTNAKGSSAREKKLEAQLALVPAEKTVATYKAAADAITAEHAMLQETAFASPRSKAARLESARVQELEKENSALAARVEELERLRAEEQTAAETRERDLVERHRVELSRKVKAATASAEVELVELREEVKTARAELSAEVAQSKLLQQKLKSAPTAPTMAASSASAAGNDQARQLELDGITAKLNLNEDLTGLSVHSYRQEAEGSTYSCVLVDYAGETGGLNFKLTFHDKGSVSYNPDLDSARDPQLCELLPVHFQSYMRFEADKCAEWFKLLFAAVNRVKI
ncbi:hypothetical protein BMF94_0016 [Rhodotorula taiwanensis]|uniref:Monopolin complex subunit Csm1/Pcs1 C-terminal domain-containing protein n=1 Tax=Rhodotorula taiwanensis TaxID=741276 RepID=A0A2S5BJ25_9BASI|nr:hypothetical protein BMF94_0016 [Rhodotorula taiwanensis]